MDDELHPAEVEAFLLNIKNNPQIVNKIARYQLMGEMLKSNSIVVPHDNFLGNITQEIKQEAVYLLPNKAVEKSSSRVWQKMSLAVAASISIVVITNVQQDDVHNTAVQQLAQQSVIDQKQFNERSVRVANSHQVSQHERLKAYLQAHSDDLYTHGSINVHPLARVASYNQD